MKRIAFALSFLLSLALSPPLLADDFGEEITIDSHQTCVHSLSEIACFKIIDDNQYFITLDQFQILTGMPEVILNAAFVILDEIDYLDLPESFLEHDDKAKPKADTTTSSSTGSGNASGNVIILAMPGSKVIIGKRPQPLKKDKDSPD